MELVLDVLVSAWGLTALVLAAWSSRGHFSSDKVPLGSILITLVVLVTVLLNIYLMWTLSQPIAAQLIGFVLQAAGIGLFFLAIRASRSAKLRMAFDEGNPRGLVTEGPYRYVRHPFYTAYIIFFSGFAIATWSWIAALPVLIIVVIYIAAARMEEGKFRNTPMAAEYEAYRKRAGLFWPKLGA
jgi:protein-S-isoprenylcysteine O-methyltransferase Ste14